MVTRASGQQVLSQESMLVTNLKYSRELFSPGEGTNAVCARKIGGGLECVIDIYQYEDRDQRYAAEQAVACQLRVF